MKVLSKILIMSFLMLSLTQCREKSDTQQDVSSQTEPSGIVDNGNNLSEDTTDDNNLGENGTADE